MTHRVAELIHPGRSADVHGELDRLIVGGQGQVGVDEEGKRQNRGHDHADGGGMAPKDRIGRGQKGYGATCGQHKVEALSLTDVRTGVRPLGGEESGVRKQGQGRGGGRPPSPQDCPVQPRQEILRQQASQQRQGQD